MKDKFVQALLEVCETTEEVDEVFDIANIIDKMEQYALLREEGVQYFDLPQDADSAVEVLKQMYVEPMARTMRERRKARKLIDKLL